MNPMVLKGTLNWHSIRQRLYQRLKQTGGQDSKDFILRSSQDFRYLVIDSPWPLLITDKRFCIIYVNPAWEKLTKYHLSEVIGKSPLFLTPKRIGNAVYRALMHGKSFNTENIVNKRKDGREFRTDSLFFSVKHKAQVMYYVQLSHDITEKKKHEEDTARFEAIINSSDDAIFSLIPNLTIVSLNPATEKMYGYKREELLGKPLTILVPLHRQKEVTRLYSDTDERHVNYETERLRKDGSLINVAITVSPIFNKKKRLIGFSVIHRDITERKKLDEQKKSFLSAASHELKTPITTLKLLLQIHKKRLEEKMDRDSVGKEVDAVDRELNHLTELINDLLDVSRFETGRFSLNLEEVHLSKLISSTVKNIRLLYKVKIKMNVDRDLMFIADRVRIEQVLTNLLTNAIKHSKSNKPIEVSVSKNKRAYIISVKDYGVGISKSKLPHIFEQFYQGEQNTQGFGLGLFICRTIVELHRGRITVQSKENLGSTFTFTLPIRKITRL